MNPNLDRDTTEQSSERGYLINERRGLFLFIFYDTETTGLNRDFDQILQFAAILTDADLVEIDRFEIRCQCLPWVVPAPMALWVTGVSPDQLEDPALPSFYEMMSAIRAKLESWGPAIYAGYNTIRFDEPLLQRAFWQCLHPPYLTASDGNARMDVLPLVQAASHFTPDIFVYPRTKTGRTGFKLDQLAPLNGFAHEKAHDALADVEATIHIASLLRRHAAGLWERAVKASSKQATAAILSAGEPVLVVEYFMSGPMVWWGQRIDLNAARGTSAMLARLDRDWQGLMSIEKEALGAALIKSPKPVRAIAMNKSPLVYSAEDALNLWGLSPSSNELDAGRLLMGDPAYCTFVLETLEAQSEPWPEPKHLEQMVFSGFAGRKDKVLMEQFHRSGWPERARMVGKFEDERFRQLAQRIVFAQRSDLLPREGYKRLQAAIAERIAVDHGDAKLWRTVPGALLELDEVRSAPGGSAFADRLEDWFVQMARY